MHVLALLSSYYSVEVRVCGSGYFFRKTLLLFVMHFTYPSFLKSAREEIIPGVAFSPPMEPRDVNDFVVLLGCGSMLRVEVDCAKQQ
jgi:hypothetical protein